MTNEIIPAGVAVEGVKVIGTITKIAANCVGNRAIRQAELEQMREAISVARAMRQRGYLRSFSDAMLTDIEEIAAKINAMEASGKASQRAIDAAYGVLDGYNGEMERIRVKMFGSMR